MKKEKEQIKAQSKEWAFGKNFNPFNSLKLLSHFERWRLIKKGKELPPPVLVTIDPAHTCNYNCSWCNSKQVINQRAKYLSKVALERIAEVLCNWRCSNHDHKVQAVCIAGGGEPLLNRYTGFLIDKLITNGFDVGVVTNGSLINKFIEPLSMCHWVSVSIDSGTAGTFSRLKDTDTHQFDRVIENMQLLVEYSNRNKTQLAGSPLSFGVMYKYLVNKNNINEIDIAAKIAKSIGCKGIHIRPVGKPWYNILKDESILFNKEQVEMFHEKIAAARQLEDDYFSVYGVTHKFTDNFQPNNNFLKCHALFMTTVFMPPHLEDSPDSFVLSQCCDRRGDLELELGRNLTDIHGINKKWGSPYHWEIQDKINLRQCPRCTYFPHNEIYEKAINEDNMSVNFI
jgi:wyosine [tRNA(Phe)-imidazoG37] synthetase (radical SAM superfamily)